MKKLFSLLLAVACVVCLAVSPISADKAATVTLSGSYDSKNVYVTISSDTPVANFRLVVTYDQSMLELVGGSGVTVNTNTGMIGFMSTSDVKGKVATLTFARKKSCGVTTVSIGECLEFVNTSGEKMDINKKAAKFNIGNHSYKWTTVTEPTHTAEGSQKGVCSVCGATTTRSIAALGHTFAETWMSDATGHWHVCDCGEKTEVEAHKMKWVVDKEAAVGVEGSKHEECEVCGFHGATEAIPALPEPVPEPTPTNWVLIGGIGGGILLFFLLFFLLKKKKEEDK